MTLRRVKNQVVIASAAAVLLVGLTALPAAAATIDWNYTAPNCTGTTIHGQNGTFAGPTTTFRGYTSRTQDICVPGTIYSTRVTLTVNGISGTWSSIGTHSGTGSLTWGVSRSSQHSYNASYRTISG